MLSVEKLHQQKIRLSIRDRGGVRSSFFDATLMAALAIASIIHLAALACFSISPFRINYSDMLHPPVEMRIEGRDESSQVLAATEERKSSGADKIALPPLLLPAMNLASIPEEPLTSTPSLQLTAETADLFEKLHPLPTSELIGGLMVEPPVSVKLRGQLAGLTIVRDGIPDLWRRPRVLKTIQTEFERVVIAAVIEGKTGKVLWAEIPAEKHRESIIKIIEALRVSPSTLSSQYSGVIEIVYPKDEQW